MFLRLLSAAVVFTFLTPCVSRGAGIKDVIEEFSYPERVEVNILPGNAVSLLSVKEKQPSINLVPEDAPVTIGSHAYIFKKRDSGVTVYYVSDDKPVSANITDKSPYLSGDGYAIRPVDMSTEKEADIFLAPSGGRYIYRKSERGNNGYILERMDVQEPELLLILKSGGDIVRQAKDSYADINLEVVGVAQANDLYGYILVGGSIPSGLLAGCLTQKDEKRTYAVCRSPVDFSRRADKKAEDSREKTDTGADTGNDTEKTKHPDALKQENSPLKEKISLNFKDVPLKDAILSLSSRVGINVILDRNLDQSLVVSAYYSGLSVEDALNSIISGLDITYKKVNDIYTITPFEEKLFDVNKIIVLSQENNQQPGSGVSSSPSQPVSSAGAATPAVPSSQTIQPGQTQPGQSASSGEGVDAIISGIQKALSPQGVVSYMPSGFVYVRDRPSRVRMIEQMLKMDDFKREEIKLKITLIRIDYRKEFESGVNWSAILGGAKNHAPVKVDTGANLLGSLTQDTDVYFAKFANMADTISAVVRALSAYGDVSIVHAWETRAMSGATLPFELTQDVWYSGGTTVQVVNNQTITSQSVLKESVGVKIVLNPVLQADNRYLVNTAVNISNIVGFQKIGDKDLPQTERNNVTVPIKMSGGDTVAISGFKVKNRDASSEGLPLLSSIPVLKYIFGHTRTTEKTSEMAILITIEKSGRL